MKKKVRIVMCAVAWLFCISCESGSTQAPPPQLQQHPIEIDVSYAKDRRTGLCFAYRYGARIFDGPSLALAQVPCDAVPIALLENAR